MKVRRGLVAVAAVAAVGLGAACQSSSGARPRSSPGELTPPPSIPTGAQRATVDRLVDGDTMWVRPVSGGSLRIGVRAKIRLLEYDTPERGECYFDEATRALAELTPLGSTVWLAADRDPTDRYGRALRYVWNASGTFVDAEMVRGGMGRALLVRPNDAHIGSIRAAEAEARRASRGLWGSC